MYDKIYGNPSFGGIRGTHHTPGDAYVYYVSNNGNSGPSVGQILRVRLTPLEVLYQGSNLITSAPETQINLDAGPMDIRWTKLAITTTTPGSSTFTTLPAGASKLVRIGSNSFYKYPSAPNGGLAGIDPTSLPTLGYYTGVTALLEDGQVDAYYAVKLSSGNYSVFKIYRDPVDPTKTRFDWITYKLSKIPDNIGYGYNDPRDILIKPGPISVAYVTAKDESGQDRVLSIPNTPVPLAPQPTYNGGGMSSSSYAIDTMLLNDVQQLALYNDIVYVVDAAGLWAIDELQSTQVLCVSIPNGAVGLLIDDAGKAIIADSQGNLFKADVTQQNPPAVPLPAPISALAGPSGFLTWADADKTSFCATVRTPINKVYTVDLTNQLITPFLDLNILAPPLAEPWSVEVISPSLMFLASDAELGTITLSIVSNALVLGIGLVPFDYIIQDPASPDLGKADTTPAAGYFYQVDKVPFGGSLSLMINHAKGYAAGLRFYRIKIKNIASGVTRDITDPFTDLLWRQVGSSPAFYATPATSTGPIPAAGTPANAFPIRKPSDLWYNPYLSAILTTKPTDNGLNEITFEFFNQSGVISPADTHTYTVLIDNNPCSASLRLARIGNPPPTTYPVLDCGCLVYGSKDDHVELDFTAWQSQGQGTYNLAFARGGVSLPALAQSGVVDTSAILRTKSQTNLASSPTFKVGHLTGDCSVVGVTIALSVPPRVIDGYRWLSSAYASQYFTLVPSSISMSAPWVDPGG